MNKHEKYMQRCLELAKLGQPFVQSNPMVGCIIVHNDKIIAEGYHHKFGENHAEVNAIESVVNSNILSESTMYVNLEPCSHFGKTPPCADLIIKQGIKKVIIAMQDPNPEVSGRGIAKLQSAGIQTEVGVLIDDASALNKKFVHYHTYKKPFITLKWAQTKNGYIGRINKNEDRQISGELASKFVHQLRANHNAILIGANTLIADNPYLTTRNTPGNNPIKVILGGNHDFDSNLNIFKSGKNIIIGTRPKNYPNTEYVLIDADTILSEVISRLRSHKIQSILVEGGQAILNSFISTNNWNEAYCIISNQTWSEGVRAPDFNKAVEKAIKLGNDQINHFINHGVFSS